VQIINCRARIRVEGKVLKFYAKSFVLMFLKFRFIKIKLESTKRIGLRFFTSALLEFHPWHYQIIEFQAAALSQTHRSKRRKRKIISLCWGSHKREAFAPRGSDMSSPRKGEPQQSEIIFLISQIDIPHHAR
jgi:hypothetical protein